MGELAVGSFEHRDILIESFVDLAQAVVAEHHEVLALVGQQCLFGIGIGYLDAHLLASARITPGAQFWTRDRRRGIAADRLSLAAKLEH